MSTEADVIVPTFPDGRDVRTLEDLSEWLLMVMEDETCSPEHKELAVILANRIRSKFN